ncbi:hypothetical protein [Halorhodospira halophila]|uniref:hypothetical protein n=1 Tax=Halorhodospira halophila TaxID=1053 RepID=UPI00191255F6|nr:hypothetical protein [Halorhodospira halophila]MBK5935373.1 hypothetical protein [Halorhodospira halophila]
MSSPDGRVTARWLPPFARTRLTAWRRDRANRAAFGPEAPCYAERLWVDPRTITHAIIGLAREDSGRVWTGGDWPPPGAEVVPLQAIDKIASCIEHFRDGVPWEETTHYRQTGGAGKYADPGYWARYERLHAQVTQEGRLRTRREASPGTFRERGGILVHIGPQGEVYHGDGGNRRLAVALVAELERIPAQVGWVAAEAIPHLARLRG